jgi:hypothetical protein
VQPPPRRWLKLAIAGILALLIVGVAMAGSAGIDSKAALRSAQSFSKTRGGLLAPPDFQFVGQGRIVGGAGRIWLVSGVPIELDDHTQMAGNLRAGDYVLLSGRISKNGAWLADQIEYSSEKASFFTFNGPLASTENGVWVIGGKSLVVDARTELGSDLAVNDLVLVTFTPLDDNSWLALKIERFDEPWIEPTPIPTATLAPADNPPPASIKQPNKNNTDDKSSNKPKPPGKDKDKDKPNRGKGNGSGRGK